jgi:hypothetical protein
MPGGTRLRLQPFSSLGWGMAPIVHPDQTTSDKRRTVDPSSGEGLAKLY